jgi:hypothetical protein
MMDFIICIMCLCIAVLGISFIVLEERIDKINKRIKKSEDK